MRAFHSVVVILAAFLVGGNALSVVTPSESTIQKMPPVRETDKRSLRSYDMNDLKSENEERMIRLDPTKVDEILDTKKVKWVMAGERVDEIFARLKDRKILGKIDKSTIDGLRGSSSDHHKKVFAQWKEDGVSPTVLDNFIKSNPALKNEYLWAATMYNGFMNRAQ
ncbi:Avirulence (Avh) protein [Phytophthora megakarya]|uniref:RxLR effector protein n=1 Tax=Phytophthora megakarya TaxID=4795 RepID=A0A225VJE8_9STRA|nr:Avirulence (Avh) protein [Phytophthora megakarya]